MTECSDEGEHNGEVHEGPSRSGESRYRKCEKHWAEYDERMSKVEADLNERFPGWDVPGSMPPAWFDPTYAGESWDEP